MSAAIGAPSTLEGAITMAIAWIFKTRQYAVELHIDRISHFVYDGDDGDGSIQAQIDSGDLIAFDSKVCVTRNGEEISADYLGSSVYEWHNIHAFWTDHRDSDPMNRNCSIMRAAHGGNVSIGHYFPDMVFSAIRDAR
jgi:hypothetical protein